MAVNKVGTWCVVIDSRIITQSCPINSCVYKSAKDGRCTYEKAKNSDVHELAALTGKPDVDDATIADIRQKLVTAIKAAL